MKLQGNSLALLHSCRILIRLHAVMVRHRRLVVAILFASSSVAAFGTSQRSPRSVGWTKCMPLTKDSNVPSGRFACCCDVALDESLSRDEGRSVVNHLLLPVQEYDIRSNYARDAQGVTTGSLITADDPVLSQAYGEFPLESLDELVDLALIHRASTISSEQDDSKESSTAFSPLQLVDLGSGCGRLVFYMALTRRGGGDGYKSSSRSINEENRWDVHGIEIANELHQEAIRSVERGIDAGLFQFTSTTSTEAPNFEVNDSTTMNTFSLHLGSVADYDEVLQHAQVLFAYSSVFPTCGFSETLGAMILDESWSQMLAERCRPGCVAITTDRILDPQFGWKLLDQRNVANREILGSIGYVQVLMKQENDF